MILTGDVVTHNLQKFYDRFDIVSGVVKDVSKLLAKKMGNKLILQGFGNNDALTHNQVPTKD